MNRISFRLSPTAMVFGAALALAACASRPTMVHTGLNQVEFLGGSERRIQVNEVSFASDGMARYAQITLQNLTGSELDVGYHFIWFDADGQQMGAVENVNRVIRLPGEGMQVIRHVAKYPTCASYRLYLQLH